MLYFRASSRKGLRYISRSLFLELNPINSLISSMFRGIKQASKIWNNVIVLLLNNSTPFSLQLHPSNDGLSCKPLFIFILRFFNSTPFWCQLHPKLYSFAKKKLLILSSPPYSGAISKATIAFTASGLSLYLSKATSSIKVSAFSFPKTEATNGIMVLNKSSSIKRGLVFGV